MKKIKIIREKFKEDLESDQPDIPYKYYETFLLQSLQSISEKSYEKGFEVGMKQKRIIQKMYLEEVEKNKKVREETIEEIKEYSKQKMKILDSKQYERISAVFEVIPYAMFMDFLDSLKGSPKDKKEKR